MKTRLTRGEPTERSRCQIASARPPAGKTRRLLTGHGGDHTHPAKPEACSSDPLDRAWISEGSRSIAAACRQQEDQAPAHPGNDDALLKTGEFEMYKRPIS